MIPDPLRDLAATRPGMCTYPVQLRATPPPVPPPSRWRRILRRLRRTR